MLKQTCGEVVPSERDSVAWKVLLEMRARYFAARGIRYYYFVAPNKESVYADFLPEGFVLSDDRTVHRIMSAVKGIDCVKYMYPIDVMRRPDNLYETYPKGDTHWNYYGAFLAYREMMSRIGEDVRVRVLDTSDVNFFEVKTRGDLINKIDQNASDTLVYSKVRSPRAKIVSNNHVSASGNVIIYENEDASLPKLVIFRDSFSVHWLNYIAESFSRVVVVWQPNIDYTIVEKEAPDVVISEQAERFIIRVPNEIGGLLNKDYIENKLKNKKA